MTFMKKEGRCVALLLRLYILPFSFFGILEYGNSA